MKYSSIIYKYFITLACILFITACNSEFQQVNPEMRLLQFHIFRHDISKTTPSLKGLNMAYFIAKKDGNIIQDIQTKYHAETSTIVMEPLPLGEYQLYILAYSPTLEKFGFKVNTRQSNVSENWFYFENNVVPVLPEGELYYASFPFQVTSDIVEQFSVGITPVLANMDIVKEIPSNYLKESILDIDLKIQSSGKFYSHHSIDGIFSGETVCSSDSISLKQLNGFYIMPQISPDSIKVSFITTTQNHRGELYAMENGIKHIFRSGYQTKTKLDLTRHPLANIKMLYISKEYHEELNTGLILQDGESKHIYHDPNLRSFRINETLQISSTDGKSILTRFYNPRAIKDVKIWSSREKFGERVLLAHYDSIPAFSNANFEFDPNIAKGEFWLESGEKVLLTPFQLTELLTAKLEIECPDPIWQKLQLIKPKWNIYFSSYGGDPDLPDGGQVGSWVGIRPVHAREAIAIMLNVAYMFSTPGFPEYLLTYQDRIWGNSGPSEIIDVSTIIPAFMRKENFRMGVCRGQNGLGGGATLGLNQSIYLDHYTSAYWTGAIFHELGHCIGYSHESGMTGEPWRSLTSNFYVEHIKDYPVDNSTYLNSKKANIYNF